MSEKLKIAGIAAVAVLVLVKFGWVSAGPSAPAMVKP